MSPSGAMVVVCLRDYRRDFVQRRAGFDFLIGPDRFIADLDHARRDARDEPEIDRGDGRVRRLPHRLRGHV